MQSNISKLGLGTVQFGTNYGISNSNGKTESSEVEKILNTAVTYNIMYLDTAAAYGNAEKLLGQFDLKKFRIVSKFMPPANGSSVKEELQQSLTDLNLENVYAYMAHRPLSLLDDSTIWSDLKKLKNQRKIDKIGFSLNDPQELNLLLKKKYVPDIVQVPYNYFDQRFEKQLIELKNKGCEIHTRSAFLQGLFFMKGAALSSFFDEVKPILEKLQGIYQDLAAELLNYTIEKEFIDQVIIGVENNAQFLKNIASIGQGQSLPDLNNFISEKILVPSFWPQKL
jgi:aryl-alcohol dehydrogenase-like predicted oxidoreductase